MSIINDIYMNRVNEKQLVLSKREIDKEILALMKSKGYDKDNDDMAEIFFTASGCGQQHGYHAGFQTAVLLMLECMM